MDNFKLSVSFDDRKLKELQRKAKELEGKNKIPLSELLPDNFISEHSGFQTRQAMLDAGGIKNSEELGGEQFSKFVSTHTKFGNWEEMHEKAIAAYFKRKLGL